MAETKAEPAGGGLSSTAIAWIFILLAVLLVGGWLYAVWSSNQSQKASPQPAAIVVPPVAASAPPAAVPVPFTPAAAPVSATLLQQVQRGDLNARPA